jgi:para-aminobenzoate synthetase/4-amino-4-deoxychorismate lyase
MAAVPDPCQGVFETLLVLDGRPIELEAHLARLSASLAALYPDLASPPLEVPVVGRSTTGTSVEALRIKVAPGNDERLAATIDRRPATGHFAPENGGKSTTGAVGLLSLTLPGGLGAHKWADRTLLDEAQARMPAGTIPLIAAEDGAALEASRANLFAVRDGALFTPPLDGRILPGITRMRVLAIAADADIEARETELHRDDLLAADEVFLTGSVRGVERVCALDGASLPANGEIAAYLGTMLRRAWAGAPTAA